jgi:hypothetical protein
MEFQLESVTFVILESILEFGVTLVILDLLLNQGVTFIIGITVVELLSAFWSHCLAGNYCWDRVTVVELLSSFDYFLINFC